MSSSRWALAVAPGLTLAVVGALLLWALDLRLPVLSGDMLGVLLLIGGLMLLLVSVFMVLSRPQAAVGSGAVFVAAGVALSWVFDVDLPNVSGDALGGVLTAVGFLGVFGTLAFGSRRPQTNHDGTGPPSYQASSYTQPTAPVNPYQSEPPHPSRHPR